MSETNDLPIARSREESPVAQPRPEESREWIIGVYRKRQLARVTVELDVALGEGRGKTRYIAPTLLDVNPVEFRQSLQERVFPAPRVVREDLLEVSRGKVMLEAGSGMGKTTFLKVYQESELKGEPNPYFPLPVYFHLGHLPEGTGFSQFLEMACEEILAVVLLEKDENPELDLDERVLKASIRSLIKDYKVLFLLDGLDQLPPEDRFLVYYEVVVEGNVLQSNFAILASRPVQFGPLATSAVLKRGKEASFRITIQAVDEERAGKYLQGALSDKELERFRLYFPEQLTVPILLKMVRALSDNGLLTEPKGRAELYAAYFDWLARAGGAENDPVAAGRRFDRLAEVSFRLMEEGRCQRFERSEAGFGKDCLSPGGEELLSKAGNVVPLLEEILQQTPKRWEYRHPSFQEYFAARKLAADPRWREIARARCRDENWAEVFRFFAGLTPALNDAFYEILLDEGALFVAGNCLPEAGNLARDKELLVGQLLKYQCKERYPQFARFRLIQTSDVLASLDHAFLKSLVAKLLLREKRDSRILFGAFELLTALYGVDFLEIIDSQNYEPLDAIPEIQSFFRESKNPDQVDAAVVRQWGEMVTISAGKFIYQMEKDEEDRVELKEYSIMKYPVTNALYRQFDPNYKPGYPEYSSHDDQPVAGINFYEANMFSLWLGRRLPTEKEWEKAARGIDGRDYPWGEASGYQSGYANTCDFLYGKTNPVTEFHQGISPYGCHDMAGNVWEWCVQPRASKYTTQRIVRGGSWLNYLVHAKCVFRNSFDPAERHPAVGLRCVSLGSAEVESGEGDEDEF